MENTKVRIYCLDGDTIEAVSHYDKDSDLWIEDYIDFETTPRRTPGGRLWKSVTSTDCPYSDPVFRDYGTCPHLKKEQPLDLIGVCFNEKLKIN